MSEALRLRGRDWIVNVQMICWGLDHRTGLMMKELSFLPKIGAGLVQTLLLTGYVTLGMSLSISDPVSWGGGSPPPQGGSQSRIAEHHTPG